MIVIQYHVEGPKVGYLLCQIFYTLRINPVFFATQVGQPVVTRQEQDLQARIALRSLCSKELDSAPIEAPKATFGVIPSLFEAIRSGLIRRHKVSVVIVGALMEGNLVSDIFTIDCRGEPCESLDIVWIIFGLPREVVFEAEGHIKVFLNRDKVVILCKEVFLQDLGNVRIVLRHQVVELDDREEKQDDHDNNGCQAATIGVHAFSPVHRERGQSSPIQVYALQLLLNGEPNLFLCHF